jgi:hypothetical protein
MTIPAWAASSEGRPGPERTEKPVPTRALGPRGRDHRPWKRPGVNLTLMR